VIPQIIDVEASGLHFDSYPIEIAILSGGEIKSWLIAPEPSWTYWDRRAEQLHGLSRKKLLAEGLPVHVVAEQLSGAVDPENRVVYSDAAPWDLGWIATLYQATHVSFDFHVASLQELLTGRELTWFEAKYREIETAGTYRRHRAADDVKALRDAYHHATRHR